MHFALHCVTGQLMPEAKPEIPFPSGVPRLSPHKHIQTDANTDNSAIQEKFHASKEKLNNNLILPRASGTNLKH